MEFDKASCGRHPSSGRIKILISQLFPSSRSKRIIFLQKRAYQIAFGSLPRAAKIYLQKRSLSIGNHDIPVGYRRVIRPCTLRGGWNSCHPLLVNSSSQVILKLHARRLVVLVPLADSPCREILQLLSFTRQIAQCCHSLPPLFSAPPPLLRPPRQSQTQPLLLLILLPSRPHQYHRAPSVMSRERFSIVS